ncbi:MAG: extracellular solute-binding protein [Myxococcota bacterium]
MRGPSRSCVAAVCGALLLAACAGEERDDRVHLTITGSAVGAEAELLDRQLEQFMARNPGIRVTRRVTPDSADERHQLYVQWLHARAGSPDVLQLDVVWTPELAAAGWLLPLDRFGPEVEAWFPRVLAADRWRGDLYAIPWFVDVGMLYWRTDLMNGPPRTLDELERVARRAREEHGLPYGFAWQGARYEGLVTVFQEILGAHGGRILSPDGRVTVGSEAAVKALTWLRDAVGAGGITPEAALTWREEPVRFAFQNGEAALMRNWPYAYELLQGPDSEVAGRFDIAPMPAGPGGSSTAALGGGQLGINAFTEHPEAAWRLVAFLTAPEQTLERARVTGQLPARRDLYDDPRLAEALPMPPEEARRVVERARPRPVTPVYAQLSRILQVHLHRALTGQATPRTALEEAAAGMQTLLDRTRPPPEGAHSPQEEPTSRVAPWLLGALALGVAGLVLLLRARRRSPRPLPDASLAWRLVAPALVVTSAVAFFPLAWTAWESLHAHDLRAPWQGRTFVGVANYAEALGSERFWGAMANTAIFAASTVTLEVLLGLVLALALNQAFRGRGPARAIVLLPWALPTVVAGLLWRFLFESEAGLVNDLLLEVGALEEPFAWLGDPLGAWVPVILADVWKTTPFVALLLLAGLQGIDPQLYDVARMDGAGRWRRFLHVTLPLLRPALLVALLFRSLDALRVFGLVYVLTGGGPGTATEPIALTTFDVLFQSLRFGYGSALAALVFLVAVGLAVLYVRVLGAGLTREGTS